MCVCGCVSSGVSGEGSRGRFPQERKRGAEKCVAVNLSLVQLETSS